jgi:beta-lactam-binding protein with PASTA domain
MTVLPHRFGVDLSSPLMRALLLLSAVAAALFAAVVLFNWVIMPIMVGRGDLVAVPELLGLSVVEARRTAAEAGLSIRVDAERPHPVYPEGSVAQQLPDPGVDIKRGRTVAVVLSTGLDVKAVPDLRGLTARQAQLDVEALGLVVSDVVQVHTDRVERGRVVGTDPGHGAVLPAGTSIRMLVSLGVAPVELIMPSLVGRTPDEARLIAEGLGLVVRSVSYERGRSRYFRDVVVVQDPVAGSRVAAGEGVTLRVGQG